MEINKTKALPVIGGFYRHFKGGYYQVLNIAVHSETQEPLVIYQALYGSYGVFARPLDMFISEVDKEKYKDIKSKYRFERVFIQDGTCLSELGNIYMMKEDLENLTTTIENNTQEFEDKEEKTSVHLSKFIDSKDIEKRKLILSQYKHEFTQKEIDCIYEILDIPRMGGNERQQIASLIKHLDVQLHYEGGRLR